MANKYVTAAFKTAYENHAYLFMKDEYVYEDYSPGQVGDTIVRGPTRIRELPSLKNTIFADGIDASFGSHVDGEAYIFARNKCARWAYPFGANYDWILQGPMHIAAMFPFLEGTVFENGVDAAFESSVNNEVYFFKDDRYALINYGSENPGIRDHNFIQQAWPVFRYTIFEDGNFDAALASHLQNEAYIFKGDSYVRLKFTPRESNGELIGGVLGIKKLWPGLASVFSRQPRQKCYIIF